MNGVEDYGTCSARWSQIHGSQKITQRRGGLKWWEIGDNSRPRGSQADALPCFGIISWEPQYLLFGVLCGSVQAHNERNEFSEEIQVIIL